MEQSLHPDLVTPGDFNDVIKDIESSLNEVDEELRERVKNLHNSI